MRRDPCNKVVIMELYGESIDLYGGAVMRFCGNDAYHFIREGLIQRELKAKGTRLGAIVGLRVTRLCCPSDVQTAVAKL
ncbi:hypothetical protein BVRB_9g209020 [Beta vulgaris subsp. vulgaris]|uniref:Uncharacterized protein n=1 Tax=Beta vulgaris subsp. vulgaris TaxID=3555 RepID=A0A0J8BPT2_BETVV|nr:hypothetical protein BVRB_9g209020 [Beta vulgaris subsp. vulgaris]